MLTNRYSETAMSISDIKSTSSTVTITVTVTSGTTSRKSLKTVIDLKLTQTDHLFYSTSTEMYTTTSLMISSNSVKHTSEIFSSQENSTTTEHSLQLPVYLSSSCAIHIYTNCSNYSNDNNNIELISGLVVLSVLMFGLGGVLSGLLTVLWNKKRKRKGRLKVIIYYYLICDKLIDTGIRSPISKEMRSVE